MMFRCLLRHPGGWYTCTGILAIIALLSSLVMWPAITEADSCSGSGFSDIFCATASQVTGNQNETDPTYGSLTITGKQNVSIEDWYGSYVITDGGATSINNSNAAAGSESLYVSAQVCYSGSCSSFNTNSASDTTYVFAQSPGYIVTCPGSYTGTGDGAHQWYNSLGQLGFSGSLTVSGASVSCS